ncbi:hypothetical protein FRB90_000435 [Tulasnella sp. 427]|nr:hypothetical protein FRB90_000435 [Tulasnella sp. 427]
MKASRRERHENRPGHRAKLDALSAQPAASLVSKYNKTKKKKKKPIPRQTQAPPAPSLPPPPIQSVSKHCCQVCHIKVKISEWEQHLRDQNHATKVWLATCNATLEEGSKDKYGMTIRPPNLDFGIIDLSTLTSWPTRENIFYLQQGAGEVRLADVQLTSSLGSLSEFRDSSFQVSSETGMMLEPQITYAVKITFDPKGNRGFYQDQVEFSFERLADGTKYTITRALAATVTVEAHRRQLAPIAPYVRPRRHRRNLFKGSITDGTRPSNFERQKTAWIYRIPDFKVPAELNVIFEEGPVDSRVERLKLERLSSELTATTYSEFWKTLLWAEEHQAHKDMENYDQSDVQFGVEVPGLSERRPSVVIGDSVLVRPTDSTSDKWFRGFVHGIQQSYVLLGFAPSFSSAPEQRFDVEFELSRLLFQRQHLALSAPYQKREILFPESRDPLAYGLRAPSYEQMRLRNIHDARVSLNPPQLQAVTAIAQLPAGTIPFIIFGPPGTGKTVTVVEAIRQVLAQNPNAKILACAPSNNAADIIADRLRTTLTPLELFRLNAPSRVKTLIPSLESYSARYDDGSFRVPAPAILIQYRVIVSTCGSGSTPDGVGLPKGHFTHIFIDEAGQASVWRADRAKQMNPRQMTNANDEWPPVL